MSEGSCDVSQKNHLFPKVHQKKDPYFWELFLKLVLEANSGISVSYKNHPS